MAHVLIWFAVLSLFALWSLASWALHGLAVWSVSSAGALAGAPGSIEALALPAWLAAWVPAELAQAFTSMLSALAPAVEALLAYAPSLAGGVTVAAWVLWATGGALLLLLGLGFSVAVKLLRRGAAHPGSTGGPASARA